LFPGEYTLLRAITVEMEKEKRIKEI